MAVTTDSLLVDISVDTKNASKSLADLNTQMAEIAKSLMGMGKATKGTEDAVTGFGVAAIKLNAVLGLAKTAFHAIAGPAEAVAHQYIEQERATAKLGNSLKIVGQFTQAHVATFERFADSLEETANIADDVTLNLIAQAKASGLTDEQTKTLIKSSADLAAVTDKDVNGAFRELLGQYSGIVGRGIQKMVPALNGLTEAQIRAGEGIRLVGQQYRGFAETDAQTFGGALKGAELAFDNLLKQIGKTVGGIVDLPGVVNAVKHVFLDLKNGLEELEPKIKAIVAALAAVDWASVGRSVGIATAAFAALFAVLNAPAIVAMVAPFALIALKVTIVTGAILGLVAAVDIVVRNFDRLPDLAIIALNGVILGFRKLKQFVVDVAKSIAEQMKAAFSFIADLFSSASIKGILTGQATIIDTISGAFAKAFDIAKEQAGKSNDELIAEINEKAKGLDFGLAGQGAKLVKNLMSAVGTETKKTVETTKDWADNQRGIVLNLQEMLKIIGEFKDKNSALAAEIANMGISQSQQVRNNLQLEQDRLRTKREQLLTEGKIAQAGQKESSLQKQLREEMEKQNELLETRAAKQIEQIKAPNLVSPDQLEAIRDSFGEGAEGFASTIGKATGAISGVMSAVGSTMGAVNGVLDFVQSLIDFVPGILEKIAKIFNSLTDLPNMVAKGVKDVMDSLVKAINEFIPNLLKAIPQIIDDLATGLLERVPEAVEKLLDALPDIIVEVLDKLPDIIERAISGLITAMPRITLALNEALIKAAPHIAIAMAKVFFVEMPKAIVKGIIDGARRLIAMLTEFFTGIRAPKLIDEKGIVNSFKKVGKALTGAASQLFQVSDLTEGAQAATDPVMQAVESANETLKSLGEMLQEWLNKLLEAWRFLWDNILKPFLDLLTSVWRFVWDTILSPVVNGIREAWQFAYDLVIGPLVGIVQTAFSGVIDFFQNLLKGNITAAFAGIFDTFMNIWDRFEAIGANVGAGILDAMFKGAERTMGAIFVGAGNMYDNIVQAAKRMAGLTGNIGIDFSGLADAIRSAFSDIPGQIADAVKSVIPGLGGGGGGGGVIETITSAFGSGGGLVKTLYAANGSFVPRGTDTVPAMLTPGEFVMNRQAVGSIGAGRLAAMNSNGKAAAESAINVSMTINTEQPIDENFIRNKIIPRMKDELRRASLDGAFIASASGIRTT